MPGTSGGTGQPYWFMCPTERRARAAAWDFTAKRSRYRGERHTVTLTGRTKPNPGHKHGGRTSALSREYRCDVCGHVGWSNHIDLERLEARCGG
jgi:hypothetical protein